MEKYLEQFKAYVEKESPINKHLTDKQFRNKLKAEIQNKKLSSEKSA